MPIIKSAKKRVRTAKKAAIRNSKTKRALRSSLKRFLSKVDAKSHTGAQSAIDKAVKKGVMHKNKAARIKKQLAERSKAAGVKQASAKKSASKPVAKKTSTTKSAKAPSARKSTTRKAPAKKE